MTNADGHDRYVTLKGMRFHYREWGAPHSSLLIVVHGLTSHSWDWDFLAESASAAYHVVVPDLRGHGESAWADDSSWPRCQEDIEALVDSLGVEQFTILGYSVGGAIASVFAATHPQRVLRLVVVDNTPTRASSVPPPAHVLQALRQMLAAESYADADEYADLWHRIDPGGNRDRIMHSARHNLRQRQDGRWLRRDEALHPYVSSTDSVAPIGSHNPPYIPLPEQHWAMLSQITCPTLLIRAEHSEIFDEDSMQRMAATIGNSKLVTLPDSSHRVHWDNPDGLLEIVLPFLGIDG